MNITRKMRWAGAAVGAVAIAVTTTLAAGAVTTGAPQPAGDVHACVDSTGKIAFLQFNTANYGKCGAGNAPWQWARTDGSATVTAPATFGLADIQIDRHDGHGAVTWASYETQLAESPVGDQANGTFRFTCNNAATTAPTGCDLTFQAYATASGWTVYPRVLIQKDNTDGTKAYCEYADGVNDEAGAENGFSSALTTTPANQTLGVGGSFDCGGNQAGTPDDGVTHINVPGSAAGVHYDVFTTLTFAKPAA